MRFLLPICAAFLLAALAAGEEPNYLLPPLAREFLAGPMKDVEEVVFAARKPFGNDGHWYANIAYYSFDRNLPLYFPGGKLCKLNLRTGKLTMLCGRSRRRRARSGRALRRPPHPLLLSQGRHGKLSTSTTINADGTGLAATHRRHLRRLSSRAGCPTAASCSSPPAPNAGSTAGSRRWATSGGATPTAGTSAPLSANLEHDNTPWVLPDGRMLYMRWEYVDRSQVDYHHLWTMNPDGTRPDRLLRQPAPGRRVSSTPSRSPARDRRGAHPLARPRPDGARRLSGHA